MRPHQHDSGCKPVDIVDRAASQVLRCYLCRSEPLRLGADQVHGVVFMVKRGSPIATIPGLACQPITMGENRCFGSRIDGLAGRHLGAVPLVFSRRASTIACGGSGGAAAGMCRILVVVHILFAKW